MTRLRGNVTHHPFLTLYIILIPKASEISYIQRWLQWGRNVSIILDQNFMTVLSQKLLKINSLHSILPGRKCQVKKFFWKQTSLGINCGLLGLTWFCWCGHAHWRRMGIFSGTAVTGLSPAAWTIIHVVIRVAANWSLACVLLRRLCIHRSVACIAWCVCALCAVSSSDVISAPVGTRPAHPPSRGWWCGVSLGGAEISRNLQSEESIVHIFGSTQKSWPFSSLFLKLYQHNSMLGRLCQCCPGQAWQIQLRRLFCVVFVPSRTSSGEAYHSCLGNRCLARGLLTSLEGLCSSSQHPSSAPGIPVSWAPDS